MSLEKVTAYLKQFDADGKILTFDVSSATVELAAKAVGCEGKQIAKTMSFLVDGAAVLIVTAGDTKIDNAKFKGLFHTKAKMLTAEQVTEMTGHVIGGVCPFALNDGCRVFLDESLKRFDTVYPAAGTPASAVKLTVAELEEYSRAESWVNVTKPAEV